MAHLTPPPPEGLPSLRVSSNAASQSITKPLLVVSLGASSGGLEAFSHFLDTCTDDVNMAFVLVQHLEPKHESHLVDLLATHTKMPVIEISEGLAIEANHVYVIAPATYIDVDKGCFRLSKPPANQGARHPIDYWLLSTAAAFEANNACVILSGNGNDGSVGLKSIKSAGGLVLVQDPKEAEYAAMPENAIATNHIDMVTTIAKIAPALRLFALTLGKKNVQSDIQTHHDPLKLDASAILNDIIGLLKQKTKHDFSAYKPGTLTRRIERRMGLMGIHLSMAGAYLEKLTSDQAEVEQLAQDLLIHVTSFFRDPKVFDYLSDTVVPMLISRHDGLKPIRIWVAGCSSGEEAYSLAIVFLEAIEKKGLPHTLQVFASDIDPYSISQAREGFYAASIENDMSGERLSTYFEPINNGFRVTPALRGVVVFTVQDILSDPPFSRLDFISCRNLLIYLSLDAQKQVMSLFHFALRPEGLLLLGAAETTGLGTLFDPVSKSERLYIRKGTQRGNLGLPFLDNLAGVKPTKTTSEAVINPTSQYQDICSTTLFDKYAPPSVLINEQNEVVYTSGAIGKFLSFATGHVTYDLLALAPSGLRTKLRALISSLHNPDQKDEPLWPIITAERTDRLGNIIHFSIETHLTGTKDLRLWLLSFIDTPEELQHYDCPVASSDQEKPIACGRAADLEKKLSASQAELLTVANQLEHLIEDQKTINEEALSVNEEYQSANEELLTSKEELQSLNEELTALNAQLQETLDRKRVTANDLQNVLYSTDVATLFLDMDLKIRFYTPATKALFNIIPGDVGRPLSDLNSLSIDKNLTDDSHAVIETLLPIDREIVTPNGTWFMRRIMPYLALDSAVEGVVITFSDVTERKQIAKALELAKSEAEQANIAKSRFLAAASHDLRQPLQSLALLQGLLAKMAQGEAARKLVARLDVTLESMSSMLNTLLDINQFEAGVVQAEKVDFDLNEILTRLQAEFAYHAEARNLSLRVVKSSIFLYSDPKLLEQMLRNLLANALKYTNSGKILLGCRRRGQNLIIEIYDTGIGIPQNELKSIFIEYHQLDNAARERKLGLGLGLSIVKRLSVLLGHAIEVRSVVGKGSVFSISLDLPKQPKENKIKPISPDQPLITPHKTAPSLQLVGKILVIEDDPDVREILELILKNEGHHVMSAQDATSTYALLETKPFIPQLILADFNLPGGITGLQLTQEIRKRLDRKVPVIILTGDITTQALRQITEEQCIHLKKPVKLRELTQSISLCLKQTIPQPLPAKTQVSESDKHQSVIYIIDDDPSICRGFAELLASENNDIETFEDGESFWAAFDPKRESCLLIDAYLPGINGIDLLYRLRDAGHKHPAIMITGHSDVKMAVDAMKAGVTDFLEKPIKPDDLLLAVSRAMDKAHDSFEKNQWEEDAKAALKKLTPRQKEIMERVLRGEPSKNIAADLKISQRTVENHRAEIMTRTGTKSLPALARLALAAKN